MTWGRTWATARRRSGSWARGWWPWSPSPPCAAGSSCWWGAAGTSRFGRRRWGAAVGTARLALSHRTPTVSSLSEAWRRNPSFRGVRWDDSVTVPVTTLDALIEEYGLPRFCKIDVEGYEAEVLAGLSHRIPALSVEFVAGALDIAEACVRRLEALGGYEFNAVRGEERSFMSERWLAADEMVAWLRGGGGSVSSGDVYARLTEPSNHG